MHSEFVSVCLYKGQIIGIDSRGDAWVFSTEPPDHLVTVRKLMIQASMHQAVRELDRVSR